MGKYQARIFIPGYKGWLGGKAEIRLVMVWGDETYLLRTFSHQGRRLLSHIDAFGWFCFGGAPGGGYALSMRHAKMCWWWKRWNMPGIWNNMCYVRYRMNEAKIRRVIYICNTSKVHMSSSLSRYVICYLYRLIHTCIVLCFVLLRLFWMKKWWNICYFMQVSPGVMELAYKYHATYLSYIVSVGGWNGRGVDLAAGGHTCNGCYF